LEAARGFWGELGTARHAGEIGEARAASREAMRVRHHGRGNEAISAAGRGVNGFDGRCGLNAGV